MKKQAYQVPELRDASNNIIQEGTYGRTSPLVTIDNAGVLDYINNNLEALHDALLGDRVYVDSAKDLPNPGDVSVTYITGDSGEVYYYDPATATYTAINQGKEYAEQSKKSSDAAKTSEANAQSSASSASTSASSAKTSETNAKTSETNASTSATTAQNWAVSETSPDGVVDTDSNTGKTQSSRSWALVSKGSAESASASASTATAQASSATASAKSAGDSATAAKTAQAEAEKARDDANSAVTKLTGVMKYAGQVDSYSDLADVTKNKGDVWNIVNADSEHGIKAGDNVAWNGTDWDDLSGTVDLSIYAEKADYQKAITSATANGATITFNHKDGTTSTATVNNVASATAATNDAKGQKIDTTYEKITDASNVHTSLQNSINGLSTGKQDKLTFDSTPTANSSNPVTSDGIKKAIDAKTVDVSNYYTKAQVDSAISTAISGIVDGDSKNY